VGLIEHPTNPISDKVIGAAIEVHRQLAPGLLEPSYHACLCRKLELRGLPYQSQVTLPLECLSAGLLINFNVHTLLHGLRRILR
jgi:hypothetical protein